MKIPDMLTRLTDAGPDPDSVPNLSFNQRQALHEERRLRNLARIHIRDVSMTLAKVGPKLAAAEAQRPTVLAAQAEIERLIAEQPDYRTIADRRASTREWARQQDLLASRKALVEGVEYFGGVPAVPNALKKILGVVIDADGPEVPNWHGSLPEIEQQIERLTSERDAAERSLDGWVQQAERLLGAAAIVS